MVMMARDAAGAPRWSPRQESNLHLALRRHSFYPLNYGERTVVAVGRRATAEYSKRGASFGVRRAIPDGAVREIID